MSGIALTAVTHWLRPTGLLVDGPQALGAPIPDAVSSACVDSRLAVPGGLFVALGGDRTDGHLFVDDAVGRGAVAALVRADRLAEVREQVFGSAWLFPVTDPLRALHEIARQWRKLHPDLVRIGITGSNGKTTTKELLAAILSHVGPTVYSRGNYNSDIGLPIEILRIRPEHRFGVFELGMNRPGEIAELADLIDPDLGLITNVGSAHIGMLGSRRRIAEEKKAIFRNFSGTQTAVVPPSGEFSRFLTAEVQGKIVRHNRSTAGVVRIERRNPGEAALHLREGAVLFRLPGAHMILNAIAAIAAARELGAPFSAIKEGVESVRPMFGRTQIVRGRVTVVQDCYNANPESMDAAISLLAGMPADGPRVAILGAMKELGDASPGAHRAVVAKALEASFDEVWLVGTEYENIPEAVDAGRGTVVVRSFPDDRWSELESHAVRIPDGAVVLLKGSRMLELERLTPLITSGSAVPAGKLIHG